jgi:hypothetical protein
MAVRLNCRKYAFNRFACLNRFPRYRRVWAGVNAACINATTLALIDAGIPLLDLACACTAGFLDKVAVVGAYTPASHLFCLFSRLGI